MPKRKKSENSAFLPSIGKNYFWLVVAATFLVRLIYLLLSHGEFWFDWMFVDSTNYHLWAQDIVRGDTLGQGILKHSPLYAFVIAIIYYFSGSFNPISVIGVQLLCVAPLSAGLLYLLGRRLFSPVVGVVAALLYAVYAPAIFYDANVLTTLLIHVLNVLTLLTAYRAWNKEKASAWIIPGMFLGLSMLTRPNIILMIGVLAIWIWDTHRKQNKNKLIIGSVIGLGMTAMLVLAPVTIRNAVVLHELMLSVGNGGINFYLGNYKEATGYHVPKGEFGLSASDQVDSAKQFAEDRLGRTLSYGQSSKYWTGQALRDMGEDPIRWLGLMLKKTLLVFNTYEFTTSLNYYAAKEKSGFLRLPWLSFGVVAPFAMLGMFLYRRRWRELLPLYGFVAVYVFSNIALVVSSEYRFALMSVILIFAAAGIMHIVQRVREKEWSALKVPGVIVGIGFLLCYLPLVSQELKAYHMATAYTNFGAAHAEHTQFEQSIHYFNKAINRLKGQDEYLPVLSLKLGKAYLNNNQPQQALASLEFAFKKMPDKADAGNSWANVLTAMHRYPEALQVRKQVLRLDSSNPEYWVNLGITHLWMGKQDKAEPSFEQALKIDPSIAGKLEHTKQNIIHYLKQIKK
jgi:predicted negative regulator of RcsB-dependent stress response